MNPAQVIVAAVGITAMGLGTILAVVLAIDAAITDLIAKRKDRI